MYYFATPKKEQAGLGLAPWSNPGPPVQDPHGLVQCERREGYLSQRNFFSINRLRILLNCHFQRPAPTYLFSASAPSAVFQTAVRSSLQLDGCH
jgi:hypothetical protein